MVTPGDVQGARLGALRAFPEVLACFGVELDQALRLADLPADLFADPDRRIAVVPLGRLFAACAQLSGCPHLSLLVGARFTLKDLGELGVLLCNCATVGEALQALMQHLTTHDRLAAPLLLRLGPSNVLLGYSPMQHGMQQLPQLQEAAVAVSFRLLQELCGPGWKPLQVQFSHARPADSSFHRRFFGTRLCFDAEVSAVVFAASWLEQPIRGADPVLRERFTSALLQAEAGAGLSFSEQVVVVLHQLLLARDCSAARAAELFGICPRTLRLRLQREGTSLQALLDQVRFELAQRLLESTRLPLLKIASTLCYADQAVFSRAFRQWAGVTPRQWRLAHAQLTGGVPDQSSARLR